MSRKKEELFDFKPYSSVSSYRLKSEFIEKELRLQAEKSDLKRELQVLKRQYDEEKAQSDKKLRNLESILLSSGERELRYKNEISELNDKINKILKYADILDTNLNNQKTINEKIAGENEELKKKMEMVRAGIDENIVSYSKKIDDLNRKLNEAGLKVQQSEEKITELLLKGAQSESENNQLINKINQTEEEKNRLKNKLEITVRETEEKILKKDSELYELKLELEKLNKSIEITMEMRENALKNQVEAGERNLALKENELKHTRQLLKEETGSRTEEIEKLTQKIELLEREKSGLIEKQDKVLEKEKSTKDRDIEKLTEQLRELKNKNIYDKNILEEELEEKEKLVKEIEDKADKRINELNIRMKTLLEEFNKNEKIILDLQRTLSDEKHNFSILKNSYEVKIRNLEEKLGLKMSKTADILKGE